MTSAGKRVQVKHDAAVWMLATILWAMRLAFTPWLWFSIFVAIYAVLGFRLFGGFLPAGILALGCAATAWLHMGLYRQLTATGAGSSL